MKLLHFQISSVIQNSIYLDALLLNKEERYVKILELRERECNVSLTFIHFFCMNVLNQDRNFDILVFIKLKFSIDREEISPFPS